MKKITFSRNGWEDYIYWETEDKKIVRKINSLIKNIQSMFAEARVDMSKLVVVNLHKFALQYAAELGLMEGNPTIISD